LTSMFSFAKKDTSAIINDIMCRINNRGGVFFGKRKH
jgi:hypothetical protein